MIQSLLNCCLFETPGNLVVPRELKKVNFSPKRPTILKISDEISSFEKTKCVPLTSFHAKVTND